MFLKVLCNLFLSENSDSEQLLKSLLLSNFLLFLSLQFFSPLLCFLSKYLSSFPKVMLLLLNWKSLLSFLLQVILGLLRMVGWFESSVIPIFLYYTWGRAWIVLAPSPAPRHVFHLFSYLKFLWIISDKSIFCDTVNNSPLKVSANLKIL